MEAAPEAKVPRPSAIRRVRWVMATLLGLALSCPVVAAERSPLRPGGTLVYGADEEGGAPYIYVDRASGRRVGFEAELMDRVGRELKLRPVFKQAQWEYLLNVLGRGEVDVVINGYELTEARARDYLPTRPYYIYQLQLMARADGPVRSWADFAMPRPGGGPWKVGVLGMSAADDYLARFQGTNLRPYVFDSATGAMTAVRNGQIDATLQDLPAARFYRNQPDFRDSLTLAGPPDGCGYYVMYVRKDDVKLRDAIDEVLGRLIESGEMRDLCARYDISNDAQDALRGPTRHHQEAVEAADRPRGLDLGLLRRFGPNLVWAAGVTAILSVTAMPLAIALGLLVAIGRVYGPRPLALVLRAYVELIRGTPLIIQLFTLFYVLPEFGITLTPWAAGVGGLALNYSAYEAEIYRAGLQAIPRGQMEAALALGMTPAQAVRRVIVPQAVRIVIPPVTGDFIALFKDTSVCSVITLTELTKQYSILFNTHGGVVEFGLATAALYMAMSLPLSWFSRWVERRLDDGPARAGGGR